MAWKTMTLCGETKKLAARAVKWFVKWFSEECDS